MIEINNLTTSRVDKVFLKRIAKKILREERKPANSSAVRRARQNTKFLAGNKDLSIALVGLARIKELNKKYRKKNKITDVLSFSYLPASRLRSKRWQAGNDSGEIVICPQVIKANAKKFKSTFKKELARVLIHGILHFLGYDHEKDGKEAKKMDKKEEIYLKQLTANN